MQLRPPYIFHKLDSTQLLKKGNLDSESNDLLRAKNARDPFSHTITDRPCTSKSSDHYNHIRPLSCLALILSPC